MTDSEIIRNTVRATFEQLGYKPRNTKQYISQNQALILLKPVRIGRVRLKRLVMDKIVRIAEERQKDMKDCSVIRYYREDIYRLLNT